MDNCTFQKFKNIETWLFVLSGIIIGFIIFVCSAVFFYVIAVIIISYVLYNRVDDYEKAYILHIFFLALFLRIIFIVITHTLSTCYGFGPKLSLFPGMEGGAIIGDDAGIHRGAWALAKMISGIQLSIMETKHLFTFGDYGWSLQYYFLGYIYYLFGYIPILGKCINALAGALTGITVYFISKELFGLKTARLACILTMFYPTLFLWSITNLRDTVLVFLLTLNLYIYILFFKSKKLLYLFLLIVSIFLIIGYRHQLLSLLLLVAIISLFVKIKLKKRKFIISAIILVFFLMHLFIYKGFGDRIKSMGAKINFEKIISIQSGFVNSGGTVYKIYPERFYRSDYSKNIGVKEFVIAMFKGLLSFLFKPFPWEINNEFQLFYYPVSIIWSLLFPFFIIGLLFNMRYKLKNSIFLVVTFIIILVVYSLVEGNVGTMIRHRDMITPIYIIFSSFGIIQLLSQKQFGKIK